MTTQTPRKPLTDATWAEFDNHITAGQQVGGWPVTADLAHQLADLAPHLDIEQCRLLVDYTIAGLPLILTWTTRLNSANASTIETTRTAAIATDLVAPTPGNAALPGRIRIRYPGFGHDVYLPQVVNVESFKTETTFTDDAE